jgi:hypothetical protein
MAWKAAFVVFLEALSHHLLNPLKLTGNYTYHLL